MKKLSSGSRWICFALLLLGVEVLPTSKIVATGTQTDQNTSVVTSLAFVESSPLTFRAGERHSFVLVARDKNGTEVGASDVRWTFAPGSKTIGRFEGETFVARTVGQGRVAATVGGVTAVSPVITVQPGQLSEILLSISADQVVGRRLVGTAKLVLLDEFDNLKTDYNLATDPITLTSESGILSPSVVNDTLLFDSGIVDFLPLMVTYAGLSGRVTIVAANTTVRSNDVIVSFNGYDIQKALDVRGQPITGIYSGLPTVISALVANGGDHVADVQPQLKSYFRSGGGSVKVFFQPQAQGVADTIHINLPTFNLSPSADSLILELTSQYQIGDSLYSTVSYLRIPVIVFPSATVTLLPSSITPDSVYAGVSFSLGFSVQTTNLAGPVDSALLTMAIADSVGGVSRGTLFTGKVTATGGGGGTLNYSSIPGIVPNAGSVPPGDYTFLTDYTLYSGGSTFSISSLYGGKLTVVPQSTISYVANSLVPTSVAGGDEAPFAFDLQLDGTRSLLVNVATVSFRVAVTGFSNSTKLTVPGGVLVPGINHITTDKLFIPTGQIGKDLTVSASFSYRLVGTDNEVPFSTNFGGKTIFVREPPQIQVLSVDAVAPNGTHVNVGQSFKVKCVFTTTAEADNLGVQLVSDGSSHFLKDMIVPHLQPFDTINLFFDVVAASTPTAAEVFRFDIKSPNVGQIPPIDNIVLMTIERPANLTLKYTLLGAVNNVVANRASFGLNIQLTNSGGASIAPGIFTLGTGGVPLGIPDPIVDTLDDRTAASFNLHAPNYDTTVTLSFLFTTRPVDRNSGLPAIVNDTTLQVTIYVTSRDVRLILTTVATGSGVATGGATKDLATLRLEKTGTTTLSDIAVASMNVTVTDPAGGAIDPRSVFNVGNTGFYDGNIKLTEATAGGNEITFLFDNQVVGDSTPREITLRGDFQNPLPSGVKINLGVPEVHAVFSNGPIAGQVAEVTTSTGSDTVFVLSFATTGGTMASSFVAKENPFSPDLGSEEFRFVSSDPDGVRLSVYALDGQRVYEEEFTAQSIVQTGDPFATVSWSGRNSRGAIVRNGVYVVVLTERRSNEQVTLKLAVLR